MSLIRDKKEDCSFQPESWYTSLFEMLEPRKQAENHLENVADQARKCTFQNKTVLNILLERVIAKLRAK